MKPLVFLFTVFFFLSFFVTPSLASSGYNENNSVILQGVISGALTKWVQGVGDDLVSSSQMVGNNTTDDTAGIFDSVLSPINYSSGDFSNSKDSTNFEIIIKIAKIIVSFSALWCLINVNSPSTAAGITQFLYGRATYYTPSEILKTVKYMGLWFLFGPGLIIFMFITCNKCIESMDSTSLDQAVISSANMSDYLMFGITSKFVNVFMAIRAIIFLQIVRYWWIFGVMFAIRSIRWAGVLIIEYLAILVYVQPVIVAVLNNSVAFMLSGGFGSYWLDMSIYSALSSFIFCICLFAFTSPLWLALLRPSTLKFIISTAKLI